MNWPTTILFAACIAPCLGAQGFVLTRVDGSEAAVELVAARGSGAGRVLVVTENGEAKPIPIREILSLHGPSPRVVAKVSLFLVGGNTVGGDELKGEISGGDELGDTLVFRTATFGSWRIPVDRVRAIVFRDRAASADVEAFAIPGDRRYEEALYLQADRGFDEFGGELDRFTANGIEFVPDGRNQARRFSYDTLVGFAIRGGDGPESPGDWSLITVSGDRIRVAISGVLRGSVSFTTEFGSATVPITQIAALTRIDEDRVYLSEQTPVRVEESGDEGELGGDALFAYRRGRTVSGGWLAGSRSASDGFFVAGGRTYDRGLGVHSRCVLTYRVPAEMTRFFAKVAVDDEVKALGVRGDVDVLVRSGDEILFQRKGLQGGMAPVNLGVLTVSPGALLTLEVGFGRGLFLGDRVDWLSAVFLR